MKFRFSFYFCKYFSFNRNGNVHVSVDFIVANFIIANVEGPNEEDSALFLCNAE